MSENKEILYIDLTGEGKAPKEKKAPLNPKKPCPLPEPKDEIITLSSEEESNREKSVSNLVQKLRKNLAISPKPASKLDEEKGFTNRKRHLSAPKDIESESCSSKILPKEEEKKHLKAPEKGERNLPKSALSEESYSEKSSEDHQKSPEPKKEAPEYYDSFLDLEEDYAKYFAEHREMIDKVLPKLERAAPKNDFKLSDEGYKKIREHISDFFVFLSDEQKKKLVENPEFKHIFHEEFSATKNSKAITGKTVKCSLLCMTYGFKNYFHGDIGPIYQKNMQLMEAAKNKDKEEDPKEIYLSDDEIKSESENDDEDSEGPPRNPNGNNDEEEEI